jgi:hypothetical protein
VIYLFYLFIYFLTDKLQIGEPVAGNKYFIWLTSVKGVQGTEAGFKTLS